MLTVIMNFHFFRGKDSNNNTYLTLLSSTVHCFSLVVDIIKPWLVRSAKQHQNPCSRLHLFTNSIWVHALIGLLKKPLMICQSGVKEIRNPLNSHTHTHTHTHTYINYIKSVGGSEQGSGFDYVRNAGYCILFTRHVPCTGKLSVL